MLLNTTLAVTKEKCYYGFAPEVDQKLAFAAICRQYDSTFYRLRCEADRPNLTELCESPIFTCKSAQKPGNEHIVGMANENGHLVVMDTESQAT